MGAIGVHHTATVDEPWDGPAAVAAMPATEATLTYCHAWYENGADRDAKGTYKFPHHKTKGGPANLAACRNGLARLDGSSIPDGDKDGVKRHLQAHLDDAEAENLARRPLTSRLGTARSRAHLRAGRTDWYRMANQLGTNGAPAEIDVYDEIGFWGVTAQDFLNDLRQVQASAITLRLNSPGGEIFDGIAISNALRAHPATVTVQVDSLAASIASVIAMAGDQIVMMPNSQMMIHDGSGLAIGNAADMREMADLLDRQSDNIASVYAARAGGTIEDWRALMLAETWYTAEEAVAAGLADEVAQLPGRQPAADAEQEVPQNSWDLSIFRYAGRDAAPAPRNSAPSTAEPAVEEAPDGGLTASVESAVGAEAAAALRERVTEREAEGASETPPVAEAEPLATGGILTGAPLAWVGENGSTCVTSTKTQRAENEAVNNWASQTTHLTAPAPDDWATQTTHLTTPSPTATA